MDESFLTRKKADVDETFRHTSIPIVSHTRDLLVEFELVLNFPVVMCSAFVVIYLLAAQS